MRDVRTRELARLIVNHSCRLRPGEAVLIESFDLADGIVLDLVEETQAAGAIPVVSLRDNAVLRAQLLRATEAQLKVQAEIELQQMRQVQAYVGIRASRNVNELADVPADRMSLYQQIVAKTVHLD
jgi:aminopeptidase